jgi:hypothetical protein
MKLPVRTPESASGNCRAVIGNPYADRVSHWSATDCSRVYPRHRRQRRGVLVEAWRFGYGKDQAFGSGSGVV